MIIRPCVEAIFCTALFMAAFYSGCMAFGQDNNKGSYAPDWDSLKQYEVPQWYLDAKFGIFIH